MPHTHSPNPPPQVSNCNHVVFAGLALRSHTVGISIANDCFNIYLQGIVMEDTFRACEYPLAKYHNIQFDECLLNERRRSRLAPIWYRLKGISLPQRWVYLGMAGWRTPVPYAQTHGTYISAASLTECIGVLNTQYGSPTHTYTHLHPHTHTHTHTAQEAENTAAPIPPSTCSTGTGR